MTSTMPALRSNSSWRGSRHSAGRVLSGCREVAPAAGSAEFDRAERRDPHVDRTDVVRVLRPTPTSVVIDVAEVDSASSTSAPRLHEEVTIDAATRVALEIGGACAT